MVFSKKIIDKIAGYLAEIDKTSVDRLYTLKTFEIVDGNDTCAKEIYKKYAKNILEVIFEWQPIETADRIKNKPTIIYWRQKIKRSGPNKYRFFIAEGYWDDGTDDREPQDFNYEYADWVIPNYEGSPEAIKWLDFPLLTNESTKLKTPKITTQSGE